jgi:thiol-disulfide isomerase/thioredoxin
VKLIHSRNSGGEAVNSPPAPEFTGLGKWLNTDGPVNLYRLYGEVVLIEFWTFGCINCVRTLPFMVKINARYRASGLVVLGIHTPEFRHEAGVGALRSAIATHGLHYPVGLDNSYATWDAFGVEFWPSMFVLDRRGAIAHRHIGEGGYTQTEWAIKRLLDEPMQVALDDAPNGMSLPPAA